MDQNHPQKIVSGNLDILGLDEFQLLEQLSESFEEESVSIYTALLGQCRDDCASVIVPNHDPVPCLKCVSASSSIHDVSYFLALSVHNMQAFIETVLQGDLH